MPIRIFIPIFSQWGFVQAIAAELSVALLRQNAKVFVSEWWDETPYREQDTIVSEFVVRGLLGRSQKRWLERALVDHPEANNLAYLGVQVRESYAQEAIPMRDSWERRQVRELRYNQRGIGRAILQENPGTNYSSLDDALIPSNWVQTKFMSYAWAYENCKRAIQRENLNSVIVFNGRFLHERAVVSAAQDLGIPVFVYDQGGTETDFDCTIDGLHDWSALQIRMHSLWDRWPETAREEHSRDWFDSRINRTDISNEIFVGDQIPGRGLEDAHGSRVVVFFSSSLDEVAELDLDWDAYFSSQSEALRVLAEECKRDFDCQLVVRTHPHMRLKSIPDQEAWNAAVDLASPDVHVRAQDPEDSYEILRNADLVVTYGSTMGIEAAYLGKPVIVMGPSTYDELGAAIRVKSREELRVALTADLPISNLGALKYGLMMKERGFRFEFVSRDQDFEYSLFGMPLPRPTKLAAKVGHRINRIRRNRLIKDSRARISLRKQSFS